MVAILSQPQCVNTVVSSSKKAFEITDIEMKLAENLDTF